VAEVREVLRRPETISSTLVNVSDRSGSGGGESLPSETVTGKG